MLKCLLERTMPTTTTTTSTNNQNNLETFFLVWVDSTVNDSEDNRQTQERLRAIINHLQTFADSADCEKYIRSVSRDDRIVIIVSGHSGRLLVPRIHTLPQVCSIYVYCMDRKINEKWTKSYTKVRSLVSYWKSIRDCFRSKQ